MHGQKLHVNYPLAAAFPLLHYYIVPSHRTYCPSPVPTCRISRPYLSHLPSLETLAFTSALPSPRPLTINNFGGAIRNAFVFPSKILQRNDKTFAPSSSLLTFAFDHDSFFSSRQFRPFPQIDQFLFSSTIYQDGPSVSITATRLLAHASASTPTTLTTPLTPLTLFVHT